MKKWMSVFFCGMLAVAFVSGCAKKADTNKPVEQIKAEVEKMSISDLESNAKAYANEIIAKKSEIEKVADKVKALSPTELFGDKAKSLKDQMSQIGNDVSALTERYQIYAQKFQQSGGDVSKIKIA